MISLERALDEALDSLKTHISELRPDSGMSNEIDDDELDSIASSTMNILNAPHRLSRAVRFVPLSKEVDLLKKKLSEMEKENRALRNELAKMKVLNGNSSSNKSRELSKDDENDTTAHINSEGGVLRFIRGSLSLK